MTVIWIHRETSRHGDPETKFTELVCGFGRWESLDPLKSELLTLDSGPKITSGTQNAFWVNDLDDLNALRVLSGVHFQVPGPEWKSLSCALSR